MIKKLSCAISGRHMEKFLAKIARLRLKCAKARMRRTVWLSDCIVPFRLVILQHLLVVNLDGMRPSQEPQLGTTNLQLDGKWLSQKPC